MTRFLLTMICLLPLFLSAETIVVKTKAPHDIVYTSPDAPLVLYDDEWNIKSLLMYCKNGYQIPLKPGWVNIKAKNVILFGNAAEYAPEFPGSKLTYVNPPDFFEPVANTQKIILPSHDTREFSFETQRH